MTRGTNSRGSVYSAIDWLNNHFSIKSRGRYAYVASLPIRPGDRVLDLGCANGSWSRLIAEQVGALGRVVAVDHDIELIEYARHSVTYTHLENRLLFQQLDITKALSSLETDFDIVTMFNVGSLLGDVPKALADVFDCLKARNGILILKDSAISSDFYWPLEREISLEIQDKLSKGGKINGYDPNFALNCRNTLRKCGFSITEIMLNSYAFTYPFTGSHRKYISQNAHMIFEMNSKFLISDKLKEWLSESMSEEGTFFEQENAIYTTTEFTYICTIS